MKSKSKVFFAVVLIVALASSLLIGCGGSPKDAAADKPQVIKLKFSHHNPPTAFVSKQGKEPWAKAIEEKTGGKVKIDIYPSATLNKPQDAYDAVVKGIADITWGFVAYYPGRFPLTEVLNLPMLGVDKASLGSKVIWDLYNTTPYLKKEFDDVKVLMLHTHDGAPITSRMPILTAADMQGKKLRTGGGPAVAFLQSLGTSPIAMPAPDTYQAAEKGVIDGAVMAWEAVEMLNLQEVVKYGLDANVHSGTFFLIMNKKKWESLPPDVQKVFDEQSGDIASQLFAKAWDETKKTSTDKFIKAGGTIKTMDPEETKRWQEKAKLVWDKWANDLEAKGLPGKAVLAEALTRIEKYKK
jgi:TRAP-type C4-dicarboxylate transport system substrate-binding protein